MEVVGYRPYNFKDDKTGGVVKGVSVFCTVDENDENTVGIGVEKFSLSDEKLGSWVPTVGDEIEPIYNKYGKVGGVRVV